MRELRNRHVAPGGERAVGPVEHRRRRLERDTFPAKIRMPRIARGRRIVRVPVVPRLMDEFSRRVHPCADLSGRVEPPHRFFRVCGGIAPDVFIIPRRVRKMVVIPDPPVLHPRRRPVHPPGESARKPEIRGRVARRQIEPHAERNAVILRKFPARIDERRKNAVRIVEPLLLKPVVEMDRPHLAQEGEIFARIERLIGDLIPVAGGRPRPHHPAMIILKSADAVDAPTERFHPLRHGGLSDERITPVAGMKRLQRFAVFRAADYGRLTGPPDGERRAGPRFVYAVFERYRSVRVKIVQELSRHRLGVFRRLAPE